MKTPKVDKFFTIDDRTQIKCYWIRTRYGFKHEAKMVRDGIECGFAKCCYYNRTWESFEYETVISNLLHKSPLYTDEQKRIIMDAFRKGEHEAIGRQFAMIGAIAKMGEILCDDQKAKNDWKERMIRAGLGEGLIMPDDWGTLSEDEREKRLDCILIHLSKGFSPANIEA